MKLQFSGHESFICKHFWLKKGYDFINDKGNFNEDSAVIQLGVGKNMVTSISYWLKAFGITDQANHITPFGHYLFNDQKGKDSYIENLGTIWLLHYNLIKINKASIYNIFFNDFRRGKTEFTKDQLSTYTIRKIEHEKEISANINTISADITVFIRNYLTPNYKSTKADVEDDFSNLLLDLELIKNYQVENAEGEIKEWYKVENSTRPDLPYQIVLYSILENELFSKSVSFKNLLIAPNSPGLIFALSEEGLYQKIEQITTNYPTIVYRETAGVRELQIKERLDKTKILNAYYQN